MNPASREAKLALVKILNDAELDPATGTSPNLFFLPDWALIRAEVVVSPPSIYLIPLKESIRKDVKVAAQNCYFKDSGAFTGEIRFVIIGIHLSV